MKQLSLLILLVFVTVGTVMAQRTVTGTITDNNGEPLIGASVLVKGTTAGTVTDFDGSFELRVPEGSNTLTVSYTGYETKEVELGASNVVDITLAQGVTLETAVVTALGVAREEKSLGYAVQEVDGADMEKANTVSMLDGLSGKAAGVYVNSASGAAGASSRVVLRGQTSFNGNNEALIVVDGVRLDNSENNSERGLYGVANSNRGMDINPNDIEKVTVLKGAAATALYGVEGARGVILITTKKGKAGEGVDVSYTTNYTVSEYNEMHPRQDQYAQGGAQIYTGPDGVNPIWGGFGRALSWGPSIDTLFYDGSDYAFDPRGRIVGASNPDATTPVEPIDNVDNFFQNGTTWNHNLAMSGGDETANYRFSVGYTDQEGIVPLNTFERFNVGLNAGATLFDRVDLSASINYVKTNGYRIQQGSNTSGVMLGLLRTPPTFDNAAGFDDAQDEPSAYQFPDGSQRNYRGGGGYDNPYWVVNNTPFTDNVNRMYGNVKLAYEIHPWATVSATVGSDFYTDNRTQKFELNSRTFPGGQVIEDQWNYRHTDVYFNLLGQGQLADEWSLSYNLGVNLYNEFNKNNYIQGDGLNYFGFPELANTSSVISVINHNNQRTSSVFGSVDVGFQNMLYLTLTGRNDWISTLIVPSKAFDASDISVFYPSASLSFVFDELIDSDALSFGKVRLSYAEVGGGAPSAYLTGTIYNVPNNTTTIYSLNDGWTNGILFPFQGQSGYTYSPLQGNIDLVPSTTTDIEVGLDLRFFQNRLGLDATYYTRESTDQIIPINIPNTTGFQRAVVNSGELNTEGIELVLNVNPVRTDDFDWNIGFNFSTWETVVASLPPGVPNQYLDGFTGTGIYNIAPLDDGTEFEYGQILGGAFQRVNTDDGEFDASMPFNPDGALIIDDSGSPDPAADDYNPNYGYPLADPVARVIGNPNPDWLLGINNTLRYKNWNLNFLFDIKQGGDMWNGTKGAITFFGTSELTEDRVPIDNVNYAHQYDMANHMFEGVKASDGSANDIAVPLDEIWYTGNGGGFGSVAEHFVEDAGYARLRYVNLSYTFGNNLLQGSPLQDLTLSFTGRNLLLITDYTGIDPESSLVGSSSNGQGLEYFNLPNTRSYALGLSVRF